MRFFSSNVTEEYVSTMNKMASNQASTYPFCSMPLVESLA
jgi:hypothetical protein